MKDFMEHNGIWKINGKECKTAPLQTGSRKIPYIIAEEAYKEYAELFGESQSLETLCERGGFGHCELAILLYQRIKRIENDKL